MPGAYRISVYNKDGSKELLASRFGDFGIVVQSDRLLWNGADYPDSYVLFSNTNVIGYATAANATVAECPIGAEYVPSFGTTLTLYEVERDPYNITFSKKQLIVKCKDKTMEKDLQISFEGGGGNTLKNLLDATKSAQYLFADYTGSSVDNLIQYNDTEKVKNMSNMFYYCGVLEHAPLLNTSNVTDMSYMFNNCANLTTISQYDTRKVTDTSNMFYQCSSLTTIPQLDVSNVTDFNNIFNGCSKLKSILMYGMKTSFNISASTQFERADLVTILNNLATVTSSKTLKMGATNLAKLTEEDKAIATNKGWTLA